MKIYVAGPYTVPDCVENTNRACRIGTALLQMGHVPFVPHTNLAWHLVTPLPAETWYAWDLEWLRVCDAVLRLPGESFGADREVMLAEQLGKPVYFALADVPKVTPSGDIP